MSDATALKSKTIRPEEASHFGALAADWWDPKGSSAMLHRLNPVRLSFIRDCIDRHWGGDIESAAPLNGKSALDVGCGAGLLCEPLSRLGAEVTGVDAAPENAAAAAAHAEAAGLDIRYMAGELAQLDLGSFDLVTCMEVIEHVADKPAFLAALAGCLADDGLLILSTPNRTLGSRTLLVGAAEAVGAVPRGTHHWDDFVTPEELTDLLADAGLAVTQTRGIAWRPGKGLHLSDDTSLNYILAARRG
ncbi:bifunctional 2-polyprenyl-6-hydroxyphenol methylase/3-demethylubiquinol 3-O-methyltransferase UbiG [Alteriqipengyuania sp. 357]